MNFSKQLKKYRKLNGFNQEDLAEKIYVTRQTISKWENDKNYPDIHNLIALSTLFDISLDELVKGDVDKMKSIIEHEKMDKNTKGMAIFLGLMLIIGVPSLIIWETMGYIPFGILSAITMYFAVKIEILKKKNNIRTYKEIIAFSEKNSNLDELREQRNRKNYFREKILIVLVFTFCFGFLAWVIKLCTIYLMNFV